jgi:hypothetical protein
MERRSDLLSSDTPSKTNLDWQTQT